MESRKMRKSLVDHVFGNEQESHKQSSSYNDRSSNARLSDLLHRENSIIDFHHGAFSNSQLEDNCRIRNYNRQLLNELTCSELLEEQQQQKLRLKALPQFQDTCSMFQTRWKELERHSDFLTRKKQEDERKAIESAQSIMPFEYECTESPAERESVLLDECVNFSNYRNPGQSTNKTTRKLETQHDKSQFLFLLNEFGVIHEKFQSLQTNLTLLKDERQILDLKIIELNRDIGILEEQKKVFGTTLVEYKEKEILIEREIKQFSSQMEKLKHELRKCKNSDDKYNLTNQSLENIIENRQKERVQLNEESNIISKQYALELQLLQDIHKEELRLYKLQLAQAAQRIRDLKAQLQDHDIKKELIKERHGSKYEKQNCIARESNLVDDGDSVFHKHETKLKDVDEYKKCRDICRKSSMCEDESLLFKNHVSRNMIGKKFQLESILRSSISSHFEAFKQEMLNVIKEEMEQNVFSVHDKLSTMGNNVQLVKTDEASNDGDKQLYVGYVEDSTICKRMNTLDCGTGMAFNFYYGYLKLILPRGISTLGIKRRILKYIEDECLSENAFPMKKLIILIPQNAYIPTSLRELSIDDPSDGSKYWIESVKPLQPEIIKRNGWERDFHLPVHRIKDPNSRSKTCVYVVAEFATPVKIVNDIIHKCPVPKILEAYKVNQQKIISYFYKSLLERIRKNNDGCKDLCEIIYYPDTDKNGKRVNIGRIILDRIYSRSASCYQ